MALSQKTKSDILFLMLRLFFPELVMSTDFLSFKNPSVILFCIVTNPYLANLTSIYAQHKGMLLCSSYNPYSHIFYAVRFILNFVN